MARFVHLCFSEDKTKCLQRDLKVAKTNKQKQTNKQTTTTNKQTKTQGTVQERNEGVV